MKILKTPADLEQIQREIISSRDPNQLTIALCTSTGCEALGAQEVLDAFKLELKKHGLENRVKIRETGCLGFCEQGPRLVIYPQEVYYFKVKAEDVPDIVSKTILKNEIVERILYKDSVTGKPIQKLSDVPFYKYQNRLLLENNAKVDPKKIEDYFALGGYSALAKALSQMTPEQVLEEVKKSKLRGRGGGGFPTGRKWESTRKAIGEPKYVIVNCDEGDPGAFMNRALMEGNPHSILEGLIIAAYAVGASQGFVYVRQEYPLAVENMQIAIEEAEKYGLLGKNILGSGFDFSVCIHRGAGAFVSGESTALMNAIEGKVGEPRPKYIHTSDRGLYDKPTVLNNVETYANVPLIINKGAEWFQSIGTENSKGTKIFALAGKVNNTGLVEVPLGVTLRDIIFKIGGGIRNNKKFKAVQTGGPSGGVIPKQYLDYPVDFDELTKLGSMMGSGGMIVLDSDTCMVDVARYFINFLCDESCGQCVPCREGLKQARKILDDIVTGNGKDGDFEKLQEIAETMSVASLCALGQTAANPMLTTLRHFKNEYIAHIEEKKCPALVCKKLLTFYINPEKCTGCQYCAMSCSENAIEGAMDKIHVINQEKCTKCGTCFDMCPPEYGAVQKLSGESAPPSIPAEHRWIKRPWALAEISATKKALIISNPDVAVDLIKKANHPLLVVGSNATTAEYEGNQLIDVIITLARKASIPVVATAQTIGEFLKRDYKPAASMSATETGCRLVDPEWKGVDSEGPHDLVLFVGLPMATAVELLSGLKNFAPKLKSINLDNMYNQHATWSLPSSNEKDWFETFKVMISKFEEGEN
ncbi:MAG: 4Fe-4S binding protein [Candidatus Bathyarchaeota archaeon]|nr:4Fe-4S binding protein [Candidatus Bathyarchaeota archaeon]